MMRNWFSPRTTATSPSKAPNVASKTAPSRWVDALHIFVLLNFAVAQPLYDRLAERSAFLVDMQFGLVSGLILAGLVSIGLPLALILFERLALLVGTRFYRATHLAFVFALLLLLTIPFAKLIVIIPGSAVISLAVVATSLTTWCYMSWPSARSIITIASPGVVIFPVAFLLHLSAGLVQHLPAATRSENWKPAPVVMLVLDEFSLAALMTPDQQINAKRFPHFAALAKDSTWFRNATSVHEMTEMALPAILSGRYPYTYARPRLADLPQNLFSVLTQTGGYEVAAFEPISRLASDRVNLVPQRAAGTWNYATYLADVLARVYLFHVTPSDYMGGLPQIPMAWFGLNTNQQIDPTDKQGVFRYGWGDHRDSQFRHFLDCVEQQTQPKLHFMHLLLPHVPWCFLPTGRRYSPDGEDWDLLDLTTHGTAGTFWGQDELELAQSQQRYLLQVMYADRLIGQLVARLKETGIYDECLLVVTADHGVSFRTNQPRREVVPATIDDILPVPLFFKRPQQATGSVSDLPVESVDILPSIADVLGIRLGDRLDGWSMFDTRRPVRTERHYVVAREVRTAESQLISKSKTPQVLHERFGDSGAPDAIRTLGLASDLLGVSVRLLKQSARKPLELDLIRYGDAVDEHADTQVPCLFEGMIRTEIPLTESPVILAVAVNGTIRATTRTYQQSGYLSQWAAMVPESAFHDGKNEVQFFRVTGTSGDRELTPCISHRSRK